jgi:hypothetical protein
VLDAHEVKPAKPADPARRRGHTSPKPVAP